MAKKSKLAARVAELEAAVAGLFTGTPMARKKAKAKKAKARKKVKAATRKVKKAAKRAVRKVKNTKKR